MLNRKITGAVLAALLLALSPVQAQAGIVFLPNVTANMTQPSFWTQAQDAGAAAGLLSHTSDQVLADAETIGAINAAILQNPACHMYDLENQPAQMDVTASVAETLATARSGLQKYMAGGYYDNRGNVVTEDFFAPIFDNMMDPAVSDLSVSVVRNIQYGICTSRSNVFCWPSADGVLGQQGSDYNYLSSIRINEPVVIQGTSRDGKYYRVMTSSILGWVPVNEIALCQSKEEWLSAWKLPEGRKLVVTAPRIYLTADNGAGSGGEMVAGKEMTMGAVLEIRGDAALSPEDKYPIWLPVRTSDGSYTKVEAEVSPQQGVSVGYLPMTASNIVNLAMSCLGDVYGWGGMLDSEDCSGYTRNIYDCFGLDLPRNTTGQAASPVQSYDLSSFPQDANGNTGKLQILDQVPLGALLFIKGHVMMYLGSSGGKHYVISAAGSVNYVGKGRVSVRSVVINTLEDTTWLNGLYRITVPYRQP